MSLPNRKAALVCAGCTSITAMPPRTPIFEEGVLMVIAWVLLILPPTNFGCSANCHSNHGSNGVAHGTKAGSSAWTMPGLTRCSASA